MLLFLVKDLSVFSRLSIVSGLLLGWVSLMVGLGLGNLTPVFSARGGRV